MERWRQRYERQMLFNQIAIMAGIKEHMLRQHGNERAEASVARFDDAIKDCVELLKTQPGERDRG